VNGPQASCIGSRVLGVRGTTYVLTALPEGTYELAVLHGEALVGDAPQDDSETPSETDPSPDILSLYPRLNPVVDLGSSAFGSNTDGQSIGEAYGLVLGDAGLFLPLSSSNFDGFWGISTEVGYRWFDPNNQSLNGALVGYDGWQADGCFHSQVALGAEWERNRWQLTALGGIPVNGCSDAIGYATAGVGIPIANLGSQSILLGLSPYLLTNSGDSYPGGRVSIDIPLGSNVDLMAYGQYDNLLDTTIGGQVRVRFALGGRFVADPNLSPRAIQSPLPWQSRQQPGPEAKADLLAQSTAAPISTAAIQRDFVQWSYPGQSSIAENSNSSSQIVAAGEQALLDKEGKLISKEPLTREKFEALVTANLKGQNLLPESHAIGKLFESQFQSPPPPIMGILGLNWYLKARNPMPRLRGANNFVVPEKVVPEKTEKCEYDSSITCSDHYYTVEPPK
jgi:hypothetical protein